MRFLKGCQYFWNRQHTRLGWFCSIITATQIFLIRSRRWSAAGCKHQECSRKIWEHTMCISQQSWLSVCVCTLIWFALDIFKHVVHYWSRNLHFSVFSWWFLWSLKVKHLILHEATWKEIWLQERTQSRTRYMMFRMFSSRFTLTGKDLKKKKKRTDLIKRHTSRVPLSGVSLTVHAAVTHHACFFSIACRGEIIRHNQQCYTLMHMAQLQHGDYKRTDRGGIGGAFRELSRHGFMTSGCGELCRYWKLRRLRSESRAGHDVCIYTQTHMHKHMNTQGYTHKYMHTHTDTYIYT